MYYQNPCRQTILNIDLTYLLLAVSTNNKTTLEILPFSQTLAAMYVMLRACIKDYNRALPLYVLQFYRCKMVNQITACGR